MIRGNPVSVGRLLRLAVRGALAGLLSAAVALGVAELVAGVTGPLSSPVIAVGGVAIDLTPVPLKDFAIAHFGSNDKNVLLAGIVLQLAIFAALVGVLAVRWLAVGLAGLAVFGALGVAAVVTRPSAGPADTAPTLVGVAVAAVAMVFLVRAARLEPRRAAALTAAGSADLSSRSSRLPISLCSGRGRGLPGCRTGTRRLGHRGGGASSRSARRRRWSRRPAAGRASCCCAGST